MQNLRGKLQKGGTQPGQLFINNYRMPVANVLAETWDGTRTKENLRQETRDEKNMRGKGRRIAENI